VALYQASPDLLPHTQAENQAPPWSHLELPPASKYSVLALAEKGVINIVTNNANIIDHVVIFLFIGLILN
jgi:hypothetical protein